MPRYALNALGPDEFERLVQSLLKRVIGKGTITFGSGADGAREATFDGAAPYPSSEECWSGHWIFQAKFHDVERLGGDRARKQVLADLRNELERVRALYGNRCDNYILATNVPLSSKPVVGTHDRIAAIAAEYEDSVEHVQVWGYDEVTSLLDADADVRAAFRHLLTPGDVIARLLTASTLLPLDETIKMYLQTELRNDRYAQLDQAGDVSSEPVALERIFTDLEVLPRPGEADYWAEHGYFEKGTPGSAMELLLGRCRRAVLIGGPGQGKSTLGQFLAQVHRATLLGRLDELSEADLALEPLVPRIPFRIVLREMAHWIDRRADDESRSVEEYVATRVSKAAVGAPVTSVDVIELLRENPSLFVFDGLDEVVDARQRREVLREVEAFMERVEDVLGADVQIIGSSRPNSYANELHPARFIHLELQPMKRQRVDAYVAKWLATRNLGDTRTSRVRETFEESADDPQLQLLLTTPLQVSIVIYVILSGGRPSRQRESLFNDYVDVIYRRERAKHRSVIETERDILIGLHEYIGYVLHRRAGDGSNVESTLSAAEFEAEVRRYLLHINPYVDERTLAREVRTLVREARDRLVLLVESAGQQFGFELRSLQEYFAAAHLVGTAADSEQRCRRFLAIATSPHWRNTALFFAGRVGRAFRGEAPQLVEACRAIDRAAPDTLIRRGATLARALAVDRVFGSNANLQRSALEEALTQIEGDPTVWNASGAAQDLGRLTVADQRDHLMPALLAKLNALDLVRMRIAATTLSMTCELSLEPIAALLRRRSAEGSPSDRAATVAALLQIDHSVETVECVRAFASEVDADAFAEGLARIVMDGFADPLLDGLELPPEHWHRLLAATAISIFLRSHGTPFAAPLGDRPLEGWPAVRLGLQLAGRLRAIRRPGPGALDGMDGLEPFERASCADPSLEAVRSLLVATSRLSAWEQPGVPLALLRAQAADVEARFPGLLARCSPAARRSPFASRLLEAILRGDEAGVAAAAELIHRFHDRDGRERFRAARLRVLRSATGDAEQAAGLVGIPTAVDDGDALELLGVPLAQFGALRRGPWGRLSSGRRATLLRVAAETVGPGWPGLAPSKLLMLLWASHVSDSRDVRLAALAYVEALAERSGDAELIADSVAIAIALVLSTTSEPRLLALLPRITGPISAHLVSRHVEGIDASAVISRLVAHVHRDQRVDAAALPGAAALVVGLTDRDVPGAKTILRFDDALWVDDVRMFLESSDPLVFRAGLRLLRALGGDPANRLLLSCLDRLAGEEMDIVRHDFVLAVPDDPGLRAEVVDALSARLTTDGEGVQASNLLLRHLMRVADAREAPIEACEAALGLPLATPPGGPVTVVGDAAQG